MRSQNGSTRNRAPDMKKATVIRKGRKVNIPFDVVEPLV
jgi:hypothetical protein